MAEHKYQITVTWSGNRGEGTKDYRAYDRSYVITHPGKPELLGSSDPVFRGDPKKYNPEELLLASLSSCHMLWYLHLCSDHKIVVTKYEDQPTAVMVVDPSGSGFFQEAVLNPVITLTDPLQIDLAKSLHIKAHEKCFVANSINFPLKINPTFVS